jgi:DNA replication protein DnaC
MRLAIKAAQTAHRIAFATAVDWVARLKAAHNAGRLSAELVKLRRVGLLVVDEVGYIPFEQDAANLFFQLVSSRYEHASLILTSNLPFARWGDVFGDQVVAAATMALAMIACFVAAIICSSNSMPPTGSAPIPTQIV